MRESVVRETVIKVLQHNGVDVSESQEKGLTKHTMSKGDTVEAHFLPDLVPRHLLGRFAVKFEFPMGDFWQPDLLSKLDEASPSLH